MGHSRRHRRLGKQRRWNGVVVAILAPLVIASCYSYRTHAPGYPGVTEGGATVGSYLWGIFNNEPKVECNNQALAEVTVVDNFGYTLLTVVTLGIVNLKQVEWKCARAATTTGGFDTPPPPPDSANGSDSIPTPAVPPGDSGPAGPADSNGSQ